MTEWVAVSRTKHAGKHWLPRNGFDFAAARQVVPVSIAEVAKLLPHYAIGFVKLADESFQPVVLLGLGGERNLYVAPDSKWLCSYIPAELQAYPFSMVTGEEGQQILCISSSALSDDPKLPRLITEEGELDNAALERFNFLAQHQSSKLVTENATAALAEVSVLEEWNISINRQDGEPLNVHGLYRISESALNALSENQFAALRQTGALILAYAQIFSMAQLGQLIQRAEYLVKAASQISNVQGLDTLFGQQDHGNLSFDALKDDVPSDLQNRTS
jgi:hypothetical protein